MFPDLIKNMTGFQFKKFIFKLLAMWGIVAACYLIASRPHTPNNSLIVSQYVLRFFELYNKNDYVGIYKEYFSLAGATEDTVVATMAALKNTCGDIIRYRANSFRPYSENIFGKTDTYAAVYSMTMSKTGENSGIFMVTAARQKLMMPQFDIIKIETNKMGRIRNIFSVRTP